jgi:hypothetical protein
MMIDIAGKKFGKLTVLSREGYNRFEAAWKCRCECGTETVLPGHRLRSGKTKSCGCLVGETMSKTMLRHGKSESPEYRKWKSIEWRAKREKTPFKLHLSDMPEFPDTCPVLGIDIYSNGRQTDNSPSLDRIIPELGYVPGNVRIISRRANMLKSNATSDEIAAVYNDLVAIEQQEADSYCMS